MMAAVSRVRELIATQMSPDGWAMVFIVALVIGANAIYLVGFSDPNPLGPRSGLALPSAARLLGQPTIDPNNGFVSQALSHRAALDLVHLKLPWWDPYQGTGAPLAGEMQSAAFFPPTLLTLISNGQILERMLLEALAGIFSYLLLRRLSLSRWACLAGGSVFALNGTFSWMSHAPINPVPFLPMVLLGLERARATAIDNRRGGYALLGAGGALSFLAGFPEVSYIDALLAVLWLIWRLVEIDVEHRWRLIRKTVAGLGLAALLAAPLIVAGLDYLGQGDLSLHNTGLLGSEHQSASALPMVLLPYVYGPIFAFTDPHLALPNIWGASSGYLTIALVMLAIAGLASRGHRGLRTMLAIWIVLAFARAYGQIPLVGHILGWLPDMRRIEFFRYSAPSLEFAVTVLAAVGINELIRAPVRRTLLLWTGVVSLVLVAVAAIGAHPLSKQLGSAHHAQLYLPVAVAWGVASIVALAAVGIAARYSARGPLLIAIMAVNSIAMFAAPELSAPVTVQVDTQPVAYLSRNLGTARFFTLGPLQPNYGAYYAISSLNINDLPVPSRFSRFVRQRLDPYVDPSVFVGNSGGGRSPFVPTPAQELARHLSGYEEAGARYILTPRGQPLTPDTGTARLVTTTPTTFIYRLQRTSPLFTAVGCRIYAEDIAHADARCPHSSQLIRRETSMKGWSASVDGRSTTIQTVGGVFQAVRLPAGHDKVTFSFSPPHILWAWVAFIIGVVWFGFAVAPLARPVR